MLGANELLDRSGRVRVEIIGLDAFMVDSFLCLSTYMLSFDCTLRRLCILAVARDAAIYSPNPALRCNQQSKKLCKEPVVQGFLVMVCLRQSSRRHLHQLVFFSSL